MCTTIIIFLLLVIITLILSIQKQYSFKLETITIKYNLNQTVYYIENSTIIEGRIICIRIYDGSIEYLCQPTTLMNRNSIFLNENEIVTDKKDICKTLKQ